MVFSRTSEYGVRAMMYLAALPPGQLAGAGEIADAENIPKQFSWKVLQTLARRRLVRSFKGIKGGYELARPAGDIRLSDIVDAIEGLEVFSPCVLGLPECGDVEPCALHGQWKGIKANLFSMMESTTLKELLSIRRKNRQALPVDKLHS